MEIELEMNCIICDEKINKSNHKQIACPYCSFEACRTCCEKYILDQTIAKCMNKSCEKEWTRNQMANMFTKIFINNEWKKHKEEILFDKEIALLPATQIVIEELIRKEKINKEIMEINHQIDLLKYNRNILVQSMHIVNIEKKLFVRACPDENCRGFLSSHWKCGLCEKYSCPDCHVVKGLNRDINHECNPDELATAKLLDKDTKCCPKCSTGIFKIEGCDQMWCILCHTAFSWKTGKIETNIHNPHFYEWQRQNGNIARNPGDIQCGQVMNHNLLNQINQSIRQKENISKLNPLPEKSNNISKKLNFIIPRMIHLIFYDIPRYEMNQIENNQELRIKYMRNLIDKEKFQIAIQRQNKLFEKNHEIYQLLELFNTTITDIIYRAKYVIDSSPPKNIDYSKVNDILDEIDNIKIYVNDCFKVISSIYGSKLKKISFDDPNKHQILF